MPEKIHWLNQVRIADMGVSFDRLWAEINLDNIVHNVKETRKLIPAKTLIMGVVKADAYGHGAPEISRTLLENGIDRLGVASLDEAIQLRRGGIDSPVHIFSHTFPDRAAEIIDYNLIQTVSNFKLALELSSRALSRGKKARIHIKLDTGMGRLGYCDNEDSFAEIKKVCGLPGLEVEGIMTHFSSSDETDPAYTTRQFELFKSMCNRLEAYGVSIPVKHTANSAAILNYPEMHLDMVRPGIMLYGLYPSAAAGRPSVRLIPAMSLKANIVSIKQFDAGSCISYGRTFRTTRRSHIAVIPVGYADGLTRLLSNKAKVFIKGTAVPVVGTICMDHCMIDITDIGNTVSEGSEVAIFGGREGEAHVSADEIAQEIGTINYEIVCRVGRRAPRVYLKEGKVHSKYKYI